MKTVYPPGSLGAERQRVIAQADQWLRERAERPLLERALTWPLARRMRRMRKRLAGGASPDLQDVLRVRETIRRLHGI